MTTTSKWLRKRVVALWRRLDVSRTTLTKADQARDQRRWRESAQFYTSYVAKRPRAFGAWVQLGHALKESGNLAEARQAYHRAASLRPDDADLNLNLGHLAKLHGDLPEAIRYYEKSVRLDPNSPAKHELGEPDVPRQAAVQAAVHRAGGTPSASLSLLWSDWGTASDAAAQVMDARIAIAKPLGRFDGGDIALFVTHSSDGTIRPHVLPYVEALIASGIDVLLIVAVDRPLVVDGRLQAACVGVIVRENAGYDFAAWAHTIRILPELYHAQTLYLINDSMFGPNDRKSLARIVERVRLSDADVVGLTDSIERSWHLQTYFLALNREAIASFAFQFFVSCVRSLSSKEAVVAAYEIPLTSRLKAAGLRLEALFPSTGTGNPTMHGWRGLLQTAFPFVKTLLFRETFAGIDVAGWQETLENAGFDVDTLTATLTHYGNDQSTSDWFPLLVDDREDGAATPRGDVAPSNDINYQSPGAAVRHAVYSGSVSAGRSSAYRSTDAGPEQNARTARELIIESGTFDAEFYGSNNPDIESDPLTHYLKVGWKEDRRPNALFEPAWYREKYPDVDRDVNPLLHYVQHGAALGRDPGPRFKSDPYRRAQHLPADVNPLGHAIRTLGSVFPSGSLSAASLLGLRERVLIVAELSIPQCRKYRVDQKRELLEHLGVDTIVIGWPDSSVGHALLALCTSVIFYRTPSSPGVLSLIADAKSRGIPVFWEVDDFVFDPNEYIRNENLKTLPSSVQLDVLAGVPGYRAAMLACGAGIASTPALATAMREAGLNPVHMIQNALDKSTLEIADSLSPSPDRLTHPTKQQQFIIYGSGTDTHDVDFRQCAPALLQLLASRSEVTLRIIGDLKLPASFERFKGQVEKYPKLPYDRYLEELSKADISLAPLERTKFNDCKSNIKFLESAIVGVPCVCSASPSFVQVVEDGVHGFLATSTEDWLLALTRLLDDPGLRERVATAARDHVRRLYSSSAIAQTEVTCLLRAPDRPARRLRVLSVNIFFAPRSFGGATIVAEHMAKLLHARGDVDMLVFTSLPNGIGDPYDCFAYEECGVPVVGVSLPPLINSQADFDNPAVIAPFRAILSTYRPDVVHFHSIQGLSATMLQACRDMKVPYVVTAHDAWWICGRQFMVTGKGNYCGQYSIDLNVCSSCVDDAGLNVYRSFKLRDHLLAADCILTPSSFFAGLYAANGFEPSKIRVNGNGLAPPRRVARRTGPKIRFGFVGGNAHIKGVDLLRSLFTQLDRSDYELVLVDNTTALGYSSVRAGDWPIAGDVTIVPAYNQAGLDEFFAGIDVLLFPTQWKESFGLTVREALLRDVWVIATDAGGVAEDIVAGENGDIIPFEDDGTQFRRAVENAIDRTSELKRHVNPHKRRISDLQHQAAELYAILSEVAGKAAGAQPALPSGDASMVEGRV